jgi:hypothetical protein
MNKQIIKLLEQRIKDLEKIIQMQEDMIKGLKYTTIPDYHPQVHTAPFITFEDGVEPLIVTPTLQKELKHG